MRDHLDAPFDVPGPIERKWTSRAHFALFGRWPQSVVRERLEHYDRMVEELSRNPDVLRRHLDGGS